MTDSPITIMDTRGNFKSFDFSPWGGIEGFLEASKAGALGNTSVLKAAVPDLFRAVDMTGTAIASLPFDIVNDEETVIDSSVDWQNEVGGLPNPQRLLYLIATSLCGGAAYLIPTRTPRMIFNLQYVAPQTIQTIITRNGLEYFHRTTQQGKGDDYKPKELIYFWLPDSDVEIGPALSHPLGNAMLASQLTLNMGATMSKISERGFIPPTILAVSGGITPADRTATEKWWNSFLRGAFQQLAKIVNAEKMDIKQIGAGMEQLKGSYIELRRSAKEDIAQAFGIPTALFMSDNAFASEFKELRKQWKSSSIFNTLYKTIEEVMTDQLLKQYGFAWRFRPESLPEFSEDEASRGTAVGSLAGALDKNPKAARFAMGVLRYDLSEEQEAELDELVADQKKATEDMQNQLNSGNGKQPQTNQQPNQQPTTQTPQTEETPQPKSVILTAPMLRDLKTWSDMATRWYKKGKGKAEDFECKALPDEIADSIRAKLKAATNEAEVIKAFAIGETLESKSEALILADAINRAVEVNAK